MQKRKLLLVDDDPDILITLNNLFTKENIEVITVDSGWKCLAELEKGFQGVILMDIMMPEMDGWETIRNMVKNGYTEGNNILVLTAKKIADQDMDEISEYIQEYITKPFDINKLIATVKKYLTQPTINP